MAHRNEIQIGTNPLYNDMTMFRKVDNLPFHPQFVFGEDDNLLLSSNIVVHYIEYYKNSNGLIADELTKKKHYIVPNEEEWPAANTWFLTLARTPITAPVGIMDSIETTLGSFPMDIPNGYILQKPLEEE